VFFFFFFFFLFTQHHLWLFLFCFVLFCIVFCFQFNNPASLFLVDRGGTAGWPAELGDYAKTFGTVFAPLQAGALPPNVHVLSLAPRDAATGDVVLRLHNVDELPDVKPGAKATCMCGVFFHIVFFESTFGWCYSFLDFLKKN
jgi:hypothetical protein